MEKQNAHILKYEGPFNRFRTSQTLCVIQCVLAD